jgi:hypothetical protein
MRPRKYGFLGRKGSLINGLFVGISRLVHTFVDILAIDVTDARNVVMFLPGTVVING